jgi:signal transduction histidine kinase
LAEDYRRTGSLNGVEVQWKRKDGRIIVVRLSGCAAVSTEEPEEVLELIAEDITDRRQLEEQLRQAQKMDAVGRLAGGVAHDFNNLLMVINGYTEVLLEQLEKDSATHNKVQSIQQAADRAATLTRQLLAFSRKQLLELKVVDVNTVVGDMERLLRPLIGENIELVTRLSTQTGRTRADAGQLEQVIMNLVVNAKDAMHNGGKICIRTASVTLDDTYRPENTFIKHGPYVMISVSDTGQGMDRDTQARIFEPFFTTKEKGKGTGLGLSTVYGIIKQSGGYVFVQSELGRGTVFTIYFPRVDEPSASLGALPASLAAVGGAETILLVEDEESVRQLVRETLESRGYHVLEAANGQDALAVAASHADTIHLIITDVVMPGLSGHELVQKLLPARPGTKVLYLSGYAEDAFASPLPADGKRIFLQKPFTLQSLSRRVREVLGPATHKFL